MTMKTSDLKKEIKEYIVEILSEEDEDREPTKAELEKEKTKGAPSKFKVSNTDFEDWMNQYLALAGNGVQLETV